MPWAVRFLMNWAVARRPLEAVAMIRTATSPCSTADQLHAAFERILPRIQLHARIYFRGEKCPNKKADKIAETIGLAWKWYRRLKQRGKDPDQFPSALASFAARAVRCGRRV